MNPPPSDIPSDQHPARRLGITLRRQIVLLLTLVAIAWVLEFFDNVFFSGALDAWGIRPRTLSGLWGIVLAPWLHADFAHVAANTVPFLVLGWLVLAQGRATFVIVSLASMFVSGLGIWLIGRSETADGKVMVHIGASGIIFGYLGYLLLRGFFDRRVGSIAVSILVAIFYGALIWGVLPSASQQSWEGHLSGFLAGACCARLFLTRSSKAS